MSEEILLYGSYTCPMVPPVRALLKRAGVAFRYINISTDAAARARLRELNQGYESVPTLLFPDGSVLTEPSLSQVEARLRALGYDVPPPTLSQRVREFAVQPFTVVLGVLALLAGLYSASVVLLLVGTILLLLAVLGRMWP
ncbi:MAG: glutaredoxin family protein [Caldilineae bacterium]|nr:MAG: glutaredoxin family protein [Caldilineae bacterium]